VNTLLCSLYQRRILTTALLGYSNTPNPMSDSFLFPNGPTNDFRLCMCPRTVTLFSIFLTCVFWMRFSICYTFCCFSLYPPIASDLLFHLCIFSGRFFFPPREFFSSIRSVGVSELNYRVFTFFQPTPLYS